MWRQYCLIFLLLLSGYNYARAQNIVFKVESGAEKIGIKDQVQVTYTIENATNLQTFSANINSDFDVIGGPYQSQTSSTSYTNNRMVQSSSISRTYVLKPKHTGTLTIAPAIIKDGSGHTYQSNALQIQVVNGSLVPHVQPQRQRHDPFFNDPFFNDPFFGNPVQQIPPKGQQRHNSGQTPGLHTMSGRPAIPEVAGLDEVNKNLFVKATVNKSNVHIGEEITAVYKIYSRIPAEMEGFTNPTHDGFGKEDYILPASPQPAIESVNGRKYEVHIIKKSALFPEHTGTLVLDPISVRGLRYATQATGQRDIFGNAIAFYDQVPFEIKSEPVKINVTGLPIKGQPVDYNGAIGNFTISSKINKADITTDDVAAFVVTISGTGNLKLIEAPKLNLPDGLDSYDPQMTDTITGRNNTISGDKIITYAITPHTPGEYILPAIPFTYYNPQTGAYAALQTQPVTLHVKQGKYTPAVPNTLALTDIHNIETQPLQPASRTADKPLLFKTGYWSVYGLLSLGLIGLISVRRRSDILAGDAALMRNRNANKTALKRLATAKQLLAQNRRKLFYDEISKAIWLYLSHKLNIPLSALSHERSQEALIVNNVPQQLRGRIVHIITECEIALYAQTVTTKEMQHTYQEAVDIISELEDVF